MTILNVQPRNSLSALNAWRRAIASKQGPKSSTTRLVLLCMSLYMDSNGYCYPSIQTLAADTGLSKRSVIRHVEMAISEGWIGKRMNRNNGSRWRSARYRARFLLHGTQSKSDVGHGENASAHGDVTSPKRDTAAPELGLELENEVDMVSTGHSRFPRKTPLPMNWRPSERVFQWARERNLTQAQIEACLEAFTSHAKANGRIYADWDEAFLIWLRREKNLAQQTTSKSGVLSKQKFIDTRCAWTAGGSQPRCEEEGTVRLGDGKFLCGPHSGEFSKLQERARSVAVARSPSTVQKREH